MPTLTLRPSHKAVVAYYESLDAFRTLGVSHELAVKTAFATLLEAAAKPFGWKLVPEHSLKGAKGKRIILDGTLLDLFGLPPETHAYRLGNRSALAWVIDQYRVERDKDGEIVSDPNDPDDEEAIVRLVGQVVTVSVETMKLIKSLPALALGDAPDTAQAEASAAHFHYVHEEAETYGDKQ